MVKKLLILCLPAAILLPKNDSKSEVDNFIDDPFGLAEPCIYLKGSPGDDSSTLRLTRDRTKPLALFKFGSVVAARSFDKQTYSAKSDSIFAPVEDVLFNATRNLQGRPYSITGWGDSSKGKYTFPYVPSFSPDDWDNGIRDVSDNTYHSIANLKKGKGDPCKLVGYTLKQVRGMLAKGQLPDNKKWRLPTNAENISFVGTGNAYDMDKDWEDHGGYFPKGAKRRFLFGNQQRYHDGTESGNIVYVGNEKNNTVGGYWSSTASCATSGLGLFFDRDSKVTPQDEVAFSFGAAVRCIRQKR